ncbi:MAG: ATP-grasp domain-containing protein [Candidatus Heimdallarchaeota archaeon]|nr:ATP-grasp domain-containing protein [Candidatus Heimdallarchaeota archaeon]
MKPRIFIQEFASGGGLLDDSLDPKLLVEGFGMLRVLLSNFQRLGYNPITTLDKRLSFLTSFLPTKGIIQVATAQEFIEKGLEAVKQCDYFLIIAPGSAGILSSLVQNYQQTQALSLNSSPQAISFTSNKLKMYKLCSQYQVSYPQTYAIYPNGSYEEIAVPKQGLVERNWPELLQQKRLNYPLILKPNDGVACEGLTLCSTLEQLKKNIREFFEQNPARILLLQEFIPGDNLSVSAIIHEKKCEILSINKQLVSLKSDRSEYLGGISNISHPLATKINHVCKMIVSKLPGVNGFIGLDFIATKKPRDKNKIYLLELNPRVTTPFCGLLAPQNQPITPFFAGGNKRKKPLPREQSTRNPCYFSKIMVRRSSKWTTKKYPQLLTNPGIITPPLDFEKNTGSIAFIRGLGKTAEQAKQAFDKNCRELVK